MKIHLITTHLPPALDGTADHTWGTAVGLLNHRCDLSILHPRGIEHWPLDGVRFLPSFDLDQQSTLAEIPPLIAKDSPNWLLIQLYPLSYGGGDIGERCFLQMLSAVRQRSPSTRIGLIVHERTPQVLPSSNPMRRLWIRKRLDAAIQAADVTFFLIEPWTREFARRFPEQNFRTLHLGSMFPPPDISREEMRSKLGIDADTLVLGLFGRAEPSRKLSLIRPALSRLQASGQKFLVLHMGRDEGRTLQSLAGFPVRSMGPVSHHDVTRHAMAMDIYLAPYEDGVSTRRTSMMMALSLGLPVIGTKGSATPKLLLNADGHAILLVELSEPEQMAESVLKLAQDRGLRSALGAAGAALFEREFTYSRAAETLMANLRQSAE